MSDCYDLLSEGFVSQLAIITNFVVVSNVGIKRVVCILTIYYKSHKVIKKYILTCVPNEDLNQLSLKRSLIGLFIVGMKILVKF